MINEGGMLYKMLYRIRLILSRLRLDFLKIMHPSSKVVVESFPNIHFQTDIEVGSKSELTIGRGLHTRKHVLLAVRDKAKLIIGNNVFINRNSIIVARTSIVLSDGVTIGPNVCIFDHDHNIRNNCAGGGYCVKEIYIDKNVWIGSNVVILKGVTIGADSVVASGCVVTKDIPANTILIQKRLNTVKQR